jgi:uncharacterized LabA/DUF88 family protein
MRNALLIGVGLSIGYILFAKKGNGHLVQVGDKSSQIEGMQHALERIAGIQFQEYGVYDKDTQVAVQFLMKGTKGMRNTKGDLDPRIVNDLSTIYGNTLKQH